MSDLIDRRMAIKALYDQYHGMISDESLKVYQFIDWLKELPSAEKRGRWIEDGYYERCSECGEYADERHNYCPNCGAKMERDDE